MFDSLSDRLSTVFDKLRGRGALSEDDVRAAMREVRIALLEADVALPVVRRFVDRVTEAAIGQQVLRSVTPGQQVVKIVNDELIATLGGGTSGEGGGVSSELDLNSEKVKNFIALLKERGTVLDVTLATFEALYMAPANAVGPTYSSVVDRFPPQVQRGFVGEVRCS